MNCKILIISASSLVLIMILNSGLTIRPEAEHYKFKGAKDCASVCHNNDTMGFQLNSWLKSPHSQAFNILGSKKALKYAKNAHIKELPSESSECLRCHVTGSGLDASYFTVTYKKEDGISCEACHKNLSDGKTYIPSENDCLKCHSNSVHVMPVFKFKEDCAKIAHPAKQAIKKGAVI